MKKQILFAFTILILLTTITPSEKITITKFGLKKVITENNFIVKDDEINDLLLPFVGVVQAFAIEPSLHELSPHSSTFSQPHT